MENRKSAACFTEFFLNVPQKKKVHTLHYTGQLLSGELEEGKEREKEIRKRWKRSGKEEEKDGTE